MSFDEIAIRVSDLGKSYQLYDAPRDRLKQFVIPRVRRAFGLPPRQFFREFWALKDVSFDVKRGQTIGVIGRNGSGKSTLLQLICGTLTPTKGTVETHGRVAALLELGSGFNPEFSGRDNVYMNAALLGLNKEEVDARFDTIAAFADIGPFIEQPVKTYSSGMYVRLAFAVIAHVDADILVIDEALSVGDAVFTQKCMRFIRSFQQHGTLLFVSHDMASVQNLCKSAIWLGNGEVRATGNAKRVAQSYLQYTLQEVYGKNASLNSVLPEDSLIANDEEELAGIANLAAYEPRVRVSPNLSDATGWTTGAAEVTSVSIEKMGPDSSTLFDGGEKVRLVIHARTHEALANPILGFVVRDRLGQDLFGENTLQCSATVSRAASPEQLLRGEFVFRLPMLPNGTYAVTASIADGDLHHNVQHHYLHDALVITVSSSKIRFGLVGIPFERVSIQLLNADESASAATHQTPRRTVSTGPLT